MMKVLFLDVEGVLQPVTPNDVAEAAIDPECCRRLKQIVDATGCKLVLSSSWRIDPDRLALLFSRLARHGIAREDFLGGTPLKGDRGEEIACWRSAHPEVERYVALDDSKFFSRGFSAERLVLTRACEGLTDEQARRCIALLNA